MNIRQGDIFWVDLGEPGGSEPGFRHPYVVLQSNVFNASRYLEGHDRLEMKYALAALLLLICAVQFAEAGNYAGWKRCAQCHEKIAGDWQTSGHAFAFENLKKSGQEKLPSCVPCHVTGFEKADGFIDYMLTPEMAGVQCEECHGPGSGHSETAGKQQVVAVPDQGTCRRCHTPGQDPKFDYKDKVKSIHAARGARPASTGSLKATPDRFDFGQIDEGFPAVTSITLQNLGDSDIVITNVKTN